MKFESRCDHLLTDSSLIAELLLHRSYFYIVYDYTAADSATSGLNNGYFGAWGKLDTESMIIRGSLRLLATHDTQYLTLSHDGIRRIYQHDLLIQYMDPRKQRDRIYHSTGNPRE